MPSITQNQWQDASRKDFLNLNWDFVVSHSGSFAGGTTNARGDVDGTGNPTTLFTVTGTVRARIFGVCTTDLAGATATLEVGVTGNTASLIAQTTATDIDANDIWLDATPSVGVNAISGASEFIVVNGLDIIETVATANITAGAITYYCTWYPISSNGSVVSAE